MNAPARNVGRRKLVLVALTFIVPLMLAWGWFVAAQLFGELGRTNNGELVDPAQPLQDFRLQLASGETLGLADLRRTWTLVYMVPAHCGDICERNLYHTRQVRIALGHDIDRLKRLALLEHGELPEPLRAEHPDLIIGNSPELQGQLDMATAALGPRADAIYLLDPLGNVVMRFAPDLDPRLIIKDLKRLLKASRIG